MNNDRLKFRVWDKKNKKYMENYASCSINESGVLHVHTFGQHYELENTEDFEVEQCTGLKDKNGNLIYDGDIIRWYGTHKTQDYKVVWVNAGWCLKDLRTMTTIAMTGLEASEIIGNIHEQKERK